MTGEQTTDIGLSESAWIQFCLQHAAAGSELDLTLDGSGADPADADGWPLGRRIPANAIRAALIELQRNPETSDPRGLRIHGADIQGRLDLDYLQVPCPLHLVSCRLVKGVSLLGARLPEISLQRSLLASSDCSVAAINAVWATITGQLSLCGAILTHEGGIALHLDGANIGGGAFLDEGFTATGEVRAPGATIIGQLSMRGATLTNKNGIALNLGTANIGEALLDEGFTAIGEVRAPGANITGPLILRGATLINKTGIALNLERTNIGGGAFLDEGFTATGVVRALEATIKGQLILRGATLANEIGIALGLDGANVGGGLFLDEGFTAAGEVRAVGATITGQLVLRAAHLNNEGKRALTLDGANIGGDAHLGITAAGEVRAPGATITGQLSMRGATLKNEGGIALNLVGANIGDAGFVAEGFTAAGEVRAPGATITGPLILRGATLTNVGGIALNLYSANLGVGAFLDEGFTAKGEVHASGANFTGPLILRGATLVNKGKCALDLDGAHIAGNAFLDEGFTATGDVRAPGASITGTLSLRGATLDNRGGNAMSLQGARVDRLLMHGLNRVDGNVDLTSCEIGDLLLDDSEASASKASAFPPGRLTAHGWRVRTLHGAIATDASVALRWLDTRPAGLPYSPQPARELADVYDRTGHPDQARKLRLKTAWKVVRNAPRRSILGHWLYGWVVGHGYSPMRPLAWIAALFALAWLLAFSFGSSFTPTEPAKAQAAAAAAASGIQTSPAPAHPAPGLSAQPIPNGATSCDELGGYPCFVPWTYALQTVVPPAAAIQATAWQPTSWWMMLAITALKACGWILVTLLLAGATGLLRRA